MSKKAFRIRFEDPLYDEIVKAADKCGITPTAYIRLSIMESLSSAVKSKIEVSKDAS